MRISSPTMIFDRLGLGNRITWKPDAFFLPCHPGKPILVPLGRLRRNFSSRRFLTRVRFPWSNSISWKWGDTQIFSGSASNSIQLIDRLREAMNAPTRKPKVRTKERDPLVTLLNQPLRAFSLDDDPLRLA